MNILNYINGEMKSSNSGATLDNYNPAIGKVYGSIPNSDASDVAEAYQAAAAAFPSWSNTPAEERFKILNAIAEGIDNLRDTLALAESNDQGKPLWLAKNEMIRAGQNFRFFATAAMQFASESHAMENKAINYTLRTPIGVVGCISPWNLPLYLFTWKIAPALAAGNCVVAKPSEFTPVTAAMLGEICSSAGLPNGVLNIVNGLGASVGQAIVEHPKIKAISFTGGTVTGKHISSIAGPMFKKVSLELGGKNPNIIFADADMDKAIKTTVNSSFMNQGEICLCGSRVFVERSAYEMVKSALVAEVSKMKVGDPLHAETRVGAIVSKPHYEKVLGYIELAKSEGATVLCGGGALHPEGFEEGYYIAPTILEGLPFDARCNMEEIFGPVITITPFDTVEEVLTMANATEYGLAATVWTQHLTRAHQVAAQLQMGIVWINCWLLRDLRTPFGGVKSSGVGREGGWEAMRFFTEVKNVCVSL
ncbi:MAG: aldehyde dehydrogenase [Bacteroidetes bacterium]|jgi:aminomuconate-semialdehyde/2-hydroxymuconate-6-semialdehyde dehydrogenase|nr:aldehyde dehydrogenase [Bacteroidota bacterium]